MTLAEGINAVLKREYGVDVPDRLNEDDWLRLYAEYRWLRNTELKEIEIAMQNALAKICNQLFAKDNGSYNDTMDT